MNYFNFRPKFLTENGNFVIESAVDRNISFRLKGTSFLNINDMNVMSMIHSGGFNVSSVSNSNVALRLSRLEERFQQIPSYDTRPRNQYFNNRLIQLENKVNNASSEPNLMIFNRRIRQLEVRVNRLFDKLMADNCSSNPCKNGGTCMKVFSNTGYACQCTDSWTGANCDEDVNECAIFAGTDLGCQNSASCENTPGGYKLVLVCFSMFLSMIALNMN